MRVVLLGCYAPHAVKGIISGSDREAAVQKLLDKVGGTLVSVMFTRGEFDVLVLADVPDEATAIGLTMAVQASGAVSRVSVLSELDMEPVLVAANKAVAAAAGVRIHRALAGLVTVAGLLTLLAIFLSAPNTDAIQPSGGLNRVCFPIQWSLMSQATDSASM